MYTSIFLQRIEGIKAAIDKLDEGTTILSRGVSLLRRNIPADLTDQHKLVETMDNAVDRMLLAHGMLYEAVSRLLPSSGKLALASGHTPLDVVGNAAVTLTIVRNAMDMLVNDSEGVKNLAPWQRELFAVSYGHITDAVEDLHGAHKELRDKERLDKERPDKEHPDSMRAARASRKEKSSAV